MKRLRIVAVLIATGCATQGPEAPPLPPGHEVLATFTGEVDPVAGTITVRTVTEGDATGASRSRLTIPEGGSTVSIANAGTPSRVTGTGSCTGNEVLTTDVTVTLNYPSPRFLGGIHAEITGLSGTGAEACNSSAAPTGLDATRGLWSYGTLLQSAKTATAAWNFKFTSGQRTAFSGRIVGVIGDSFTSLPNPFRNNMSTFAYARNRIVYPDASGPTLVSVGLDGTNLDAPVTLPLTGTSVAASLGATSADDLVWFTTSYSGLTAYVGVVKGDGTVIYTNGAPGASTNPNLLNIIVDPVTPNRAWYVHGSVGFRSVTYDPDAGTLALGTLVSLGRASSIAFGPAPDRYIFATTGTNNQINAYSATDRSLKGSFTPTAECGNPVAILLGPDDKLWFAQNAPGNLGFCNVDASGTTFTKIMASPNPRGLAVAGSVVGPGRSVWAADYTNKTVTELVEGASAFFSVVIDNIDVRAIGVSPVVATPVTHPEYIWVCTQAGLRRLQPQ